MIAMIGFDPSEIASNAMLFQSGAFTAEGQ